MGVRRLGKQMNRQEGSTQKLGKLDKKYHFTFNPYPDERLSSCPDCRGKNGQRKLPLIVHIDPDNLILLNYTCRYCNNCDRLIGHKHEIEHHLTTMFLKINPSFIGNEYMVFGTVDKKTWDEKSRRSADPSDILHHAHDFLSYHNLRMTMTGWFPEGQEPPIMKPPPSMEWVKTD